MLQRENWLSIEKEKVRGKKIGPRRFGDIIGFFNNTQ